MKQSTTMKAKQFSLKQRANSFRYAWEGICTFFAQEHNAWIHLAASISVFIAAWCLNVSGKEMVLLIMATGLVWVAEIFNTAIERTIDVISPGYHPAVKRLKDISAAAVLVAAFISVIAGAYVFIPKIF